MSTARDTLERNAWLFEERDRRLTALATRNPYRLAPNQRTWQDWREIGNAVNDTGREPDEADEWLGFAMTVAPDLRTCKAILRGERVPLSRLDPIGAKAYGLIPRE